MKAITRKEQFLSAIAGEIEAPEPRTREEVYMKKISENGSGGSEPEVVIITRSGSTEHIGYVKQKMIDSLDNNVPTIFYFKKTDGIYLVSSINRNDGQLNFSVVTYDASLGDQTVKTILYNITDSNTIEPII